MVNEVSIELRFCGHEFLSATAEYSQFSLLQQTLIETRAMSHQTAIKSAEWRT
jgi:hypothetical protein